jgi:putative hemolysin
MTLAANTLHAPLRFAPFKSAADLATLRTDVDVLTIPDSENGLYHAGFACSERAIAEALRLRYAVFNEELGEGLMTSRLTGMDRDEFDDQMHHLVLVEKGTDRVVGTYRLQPVEKALKAEGIYSGREYQLDPITPYFDLLVEAGRACLSVDHRNFTAVMLMWKGIRSYMETHQQRYLFGCCSITTLDPLDGWRAKKTLREMGVLHPTLNLAPTAAFTCGDPAQEFASDLGPGIKIPKLFSAYLRLGCHVISEPAIDREFGTVDFLIFLDAQEVSFSSVMLR